ncbi:MAG: RNA polymerase Rpb4 [Thaumarchaeota archaeon]|nr:RNA polymerase Rpb4 [Nitrososphaerota archaeon]|tara:strand:+ start:2860 stop:3186 length:327 start_codon:yes stop_codon:yes gene_type:complete
MNKKKSTIISVAQVKDILAKLDLDDADQIQKRTFDYVKNFPDSDYKKIDKAAKELSSSEYVTLEQAYEILNVNPQTIPELRVFTSAWKKLIPSEELEKILSITQESYS